MSSETTKNQYSFCIPKKCPKYIAHFFEYAKTQDQANKDSYTHVADSTDLLWDGFQTLGKKREEKGDGEKKDKSKSSPKETQNELNQIQGILLQKLKKKFQNTPEEYKKYAAALDRIILTINGSNDNNSEN